MEYITVKEAAAIWGVTPRRVQALCKEGKIPYAKRWGRTWMIPAKTAFPSNKTKAIDDDVEVNVPRRSPSLIMSDLYHTPGTADQVAEALADNLEEVLIFKAELAYNRGELNKVFEYARELFDIHTGCYHVVAIGFLLTLCAAYKGDVKLYREARKHMYEVSYENEEEREILLLWLSLADMKAKETDDFPQWFKMGKFDCVTADAYPAVKFQYAKYLHLKATTMTIRKATDDREEGRALMKTLPYMLEPMISQARVDKTLLPEIGLRLLCAVTYHYLGRDEEAISHIDEAINLCLPDGLFMVLMEFRRPLDTLLDKRLALIDKNISKKLKTMERQMMSGWTKIYNELNQRIVSNSLSVRERQISRMAAFGLSNKEIADRLNISVTSVKAIISMAMNKTGAQNRKELGAYV